MSEQQAVEGIVRELLGRVGLQVERVVASGEEVVIVARGRIGQKPPAHRGASGTAADGEPNPVTPNAREIPSRLDVRLEGAGLAGGVPGLPPVPRFDVAAMARSLGGPVGDPAAVLSRLRQEAPELAYQLGAQAPLEHAPDPMDRFRA